MISVRLKKIILPIMFIPTKMFSAVTSVPLSGAGSQFNVIGEQLYTSAGTYSWVVPAGVQFVSVVVVGGGGSCYVGGNSSFGNFAVAYGGNGRNGGSYSFPTSCSSCGGGSGGTGGAAGSWYDGGGGGGAGGYLARGGDGAFGQTWSAGFGGGGNGGVGGQDTCYPGGGGVGLYGINGSVSSVTSTPGSYSGTNSLSGSYGYFGAGQAGCGGGDTQGGGGGGLAWVNNISVNPGATITVTVGSLASNCGDGGGSGGAVRIIWGAGRSFPYNAN